MFNRSHRCDKPPRSRELPLRADNKDTPATQTNPVDARAMQDPANNPTPGEPPLTVSDEEVERLLQQAESLTKEIVEDVGEKPTPDAAHDNTGGQFGTVEPDPEAAVELVAQDIAHLTKTITVEPPTETIENEDAVSIAMTDALPVATDQDVEATDEALTVTTDEVQPDVDVEMSPTDDHVAVGADPNESTNSPDSTSPEADDATAAPGLEWPIQRRGITRVARHVALYSARSLIFAVPNACIRLIMLLDLPFRGFRPGVKSVLGVIGLISLLMGGVAMLAPSMMQSNPYALMPPQPHMEVPPASEHGGEAKAEHKEEAKPAHDEKKPEGGGHH